MTEYLNLPAIPLPTDSVTLVARVEGYLEKVHFKDGAPGQEAAICSSPFSRTSTRRSCSRRRPKSPRSRQRWGTPKRACPLYGACLKKMPQRKPKWIAGNIKRDSADAALLYAQAQVELAKLNLELYKVKAPFDGRIGRHLVNPGNVVGAMAGIRTSLAEIDQHRSPLRLLHDQRARPAARYRAPETDRRADP